MNAHFQQSIRQQPAVLVAEDEVLVRMAVVDALAMRGFTVYEAGTAAEAIRLLEDGTRVDLVFSDIRMPGGLSGIDLANWVHMHRPGMEVVLTSGDTRAAEIVSQCGQAECFIGKPYDIDSTITRLTQLVRRPVC